MKRMIWANWHKWGNFGLGPIPTRQLSSALFALSGHILLALGLVLGLSQKPPERITPPKSKAIQVQFQTTPATPSAPKPPVLQPRSSELVNPGSPEPAKVISEPQPTVEPESGSSSQASAPISTSPPQPGHASTPGAGAPEMPGEEVAYYYPTRQLQQKPRVIEDIDTNLTLTLPGIETQNVILRLFINEHGGIDHIDIEQTTLEPEVVAAVSGAFGKLRFSPGKIDGLAVKSQLKIEVLLENKDAAKISRKSDL